MALLIPLLLLLHMQAFAAEESDDFAAWLEGLRRQAQAQEIGDKTLKAALEGLEPLQGVLKLERRQPESTLSFAKYLQLVTPQKRLEKGQSLLEQHGKLLEAIAKRYGVQPRFIVALWGLESAFGEKLGDWPAIGALATLAYAGRRPAFFRRQLIEALRILAKGHIAQKDMVSSWAGAMGQCQFMPGNFFPYAVDFDGDGRRDIWHNRGDALASIAHYLDKSGWKADQTWGRQVQMPADFDHRLGGRNVRMTLDRWQVLGLRRLNGQALPKRKLWASLVLPEGNKGRAYLVYDNFRSLLKWNNSTHFALAAGLFADQLKRR